ncbi:MAG: histidine phosphatase family protein [Candidatus Eremiobacterota bacterium]
MNIYLIRHGETVYNREGRFQGQSNIPLNEAGREQAQKVARRFEDQFIQSGENFAAIYSSPFDRTMDTAKAIAEKLHLTPTELPSFKEINMGEWEGQTKTEVLEKYKDQNGVPLLKKWHDDPLNNNIPGGETVRQVDNRVTAGLNEIVKNHKPDDNIIIVTHGGPVSVVACHAMKESLKEVSKKKIENTAVTVVQLDTDIDHSKMLLYNDASHLNNYLSPYM